MAPTIAYCQAVGIASWEGLWARFPDPNLEALRLPGASDFGGPFAERLATIFLAERRARQDIGTHGIWRQAILTNGTPGAIAGSRMAHYFDAITVAGEVGVGKPDARVFGAALKAAGAPAGGTVMVGDNLRRDVQGAQQAGLRAFWLNRDGREPELDVTPGAEIASRRGNGDSGGAAIGGGLPTISRREDVVDLEQVPGGAGTPGLPIDVAATSSVAEPHLPSDGHRDGAACRDSRLRRRSEGTVRSRRRLRRRRGVVCRSSWRLVEGALPSEQVRRMRPTELARVTDLTEHHRPKHPHAGTDPGRRRIPQLLRSQDRRPSRGVTCPSDPDLHAVDAGGGGDAPHAAGVGGGAVAALKDHPVAGGLTGGVGPETRTSRRTWPDPRCRRARAPAPQRVPR